MVQEQRAQDEVEAAVAEGQPESITGRLGIWRSREMLETIVERCHASAAPDASNDARAIARCRADIQDRELLILPSEAAHQTSQHAMAAQIASDMNQVTQARLLVAPFLVVQQLRKDHPGPCCTH